MECASSWKFMDVSTERKRQRGAPRHEVLARVDEEEEDEEGAEPDGHGVALGVGADVLE